MKKYFLILFLLLSTSSLLYSQHATYGFKTGPSLARGTVDTVSLGLQIGAQLEYVFSSNIAFGSELNINTQPGIPIDWVLQVKYYFKLKQKEIIPFIGVGTQVWFFEGGPYYAASVGAGVDLWLSKKFIVPIDLQFGRIFIDEGEVISFAGTVGIKYFF
jgi:hypothetical protein